GGPYNGVTWLLRNLRDLFDSEFAPTAFIEGELGIKEIAMIPEQPGDAIVRATALFICGERDDDVAIGLETLLLVLDQVGDPDSRSEERRVGKECRLRCEQAAEEIIRATDLFICCERDYDVELGLDTLLLVLTQVGDGAR